MVINRRIKLILLIVIVLSLPLVILAVRQRQETRSGAAAPDKLEAEGGVLSSTGVNKQTDSLASGGQFVSLGLNSEIWFHPNFASDIIDLFNEPDKWTNARSKVQVFSWFHQQLTNNCFGSSICGPNTLDNLAAANAFSKLRAWGIKQAIEIGAVKWHSCEAYKTAPQALLRIEAVVSRGGEVDYIAMDEPYIGGILGVGGRTCGYTMEQSAVQTADFIARVKAVHPNVKIGDIEPYPYFSFGELKQWIIKLEALGVKPAFFQLDVNRGASTYSEQAFKTGAADFNAFLKSRGIPLGIILKSYDSANNSTDKLYYEEVMRWTGVVKSAVGITEQTIFQSWHVRTGTGILDIPVNTPENDLAIYSHTRLINDGWSLLTSP